MSIYKHLRNLVCIFCHSKPLLATRKSLLFQFTYPSSPGILSFSVCVSLHSSLSLHPSLSPPHLPVSVSPSHPPLSEIKPTWDICPEGTNALPPIASFHLLACQRQLQGRQLEKLTGQTLRSLDHHTGGFLFRFCLLFLCNHA